MRATIIGLAIALGLAGQLSAQTPAIDDPSSADQVRPVVRRRPEPPYIIRPFGLVTGQQFTASTTFKAIFDSSVGPFFGGGVQVAFRSGLFAEVGISRFSNTGERAFRSNGETFRVGIPLTATITPIEVTGGYRFRLRRHRGIVPYLGAGVGSYGYHETSPSPDPGENLDTRHVGYLAVGGVEFRVHRWITLSGDGQFTHVPGILGNGGLSQELNDDDLGGIAGRFRVIIGR